MEPWVWIVIAAAVAVIAVILAIWMFGQKRQTEHLRERFGPEYERAVRDTGSRGRAERELETREDRVQHLQIRPLAPDQRAHYAESWRGVQSHFVDDPPRAIVEADELVSEVMQARGYPVGDFERRAADISVDHPYVVEHYRAADEIATRNARGDADTEDLRQAMVHYRALFDGLLETSGSERMEGSR
jgi:hypothetical protein